MRLRRRTSLRLTALFAVALLGFVQASFAVSGCLGTRESSTLDAADFPPCARCLLQCRAHCQAEDQTIDSPGAAPIALDQLPATLIPLLLVALDPGFAPRAFSAIVPRAEPPPHIRFARLLN